VRRARGPTDTVYSTAVHVQHVYCTEVILSYEDTVEYFRTKVLSKILSYFRKYESTFVLSYESTRTSRSPDSRTNSFSAFIFLDSQNSGRHAPVSVISEDSGASHLFFVFQADSLHTYMLVLSCARREALLVAALTSFVFHCSKYIQWPCWIYTTPAAGDGPWLDDSMSVCGIDMSAVGMSVISGCVEHQECKVTPYSRDKIFLSRLFEVHVILFSCVASSCQAVVFTRSPTTFPFIRGVCPH